MNAHQFKKDDVVKFKQFDTIVRGKVNGFLPDGDYEIELLKDAGIIKKGTIISVVAEAILS